MGKTGSSSIKFALKANKPLLTKNGIKYLGLMLEHTDEKLYEWQNIHGWPTFKREMKDEANNQLIGSFKHIEKTLSPQITQLIWSNETLFVNHEFISPTLLFLKEIFDVQVIAYIRRPDAWITSAYIQWGIKHKTYKGPLKRFKQWVNSRPFSLAPYMQQWTSMFSQTHFYNFDMIGDVAQHFVQEVIKIDSEDIIISQKNVTLPPAAVALFAYYNSCFERQVHPREIESLLRKSGVLDTNNPLGNINNYLPKKEDIRSYLDKSVSDLKDINKILKGIGEPEIDTSEIRFNEFNAKQVDVNRALLQLIVYLSNRVNRLERKTRTENTE